MSFEMDGGCLAILFALGVILLPIVLRLAGVIAWPWLWVLAPVWVIPVGVVVYIVGWYAIKLILDLTG